MLKKIIRTLALAMPIALVACGGSNTDEAAAITTTTSVAKSCTGSFVGTYDKPSEAELIRVRDLYYQRFGIVGPVDGPDVEVDSNRYIYMKGSFAFETDANCEVIKGTTMVFDEYPFAILGKIMPTITSSLTWSDYSVLSGELTIKVDANNAISGDFFYPAPDNYVYGVISGTFTPNGKI